MKEEWYINFSKIWFPYLSITQTPVFIQYCVRSSRIISLLFNTLLMVKGWNRSKPAKEKKQEWQY